VFDKVKWGRKIFKIYKTLKQAESKCIIFKSQVLLSKKILKLVIVLYNLKKGMAPSEVRDQLSLERLTNRTDEMCNETVLSKSDNDNGTIEEESSDHYQQ
jgi:hypothetical protein